jgi:uncharacterized protein (DUF983 family)
MKLGNWLHKLLVTARLRCPNCEEGRIFSGFKINPTCPVCGVQFERREGESVGGVMINLVLVESSAIIGFFVVDAMTDIPPLTQLWFWIPYNLVMPILLYRSTRALWIGVAYLNGDVTYADKEDKNEAPKG